MTVFWVLVSLVILAGLAFMVVKIQRREARTKDCPECGMKVPAGVAQCAACGHDFIGTRRYA